MARHADAVHVQAIADRRTFAAQPLELVDDKNDVPGAIDDVVLVIEGLLQFLFRPQALLHVVVAALVLHVDGHVAATCPVTPQIGAIVFRASQAGRENDHGESLGAALRIIDFCRDDTACAPRRSK